ncbi:MAG: ABC transporter permease [candidate division Zixibacteria bacterium]|nr:ABC transporter permease [candidate division Zixibacteria bacterium]
MKIILHLLKKEFLQFRRDKRMFAISFIAPVFQLIMLGYAANLDVSNMPTVVYNNDNSQISRELVNEFSNSGYFEIVRQLDRYSDINETIDNGTASIAIVIPIGFGNDIKAGKTAALQVISDGSDANSATIGLNYISMIVADYSSDILFDSFKRAKGQTIKLPLIKPEVRIWYNPALKSRNFMVPGVLAMLLMVVTMILTSLAIVKEREIGTMEQLIVTPIKPFQLILGKVLPFSIIGFIDILLVIMVAVFWFGIPVKGNAFLLLVLSVIFLMTTLGLGMLISTFSRTQQQAMMSAIFFIMMPMMFLSGFIFPIENMPRVIQYFSYLLPLRYFFVIIRGIFLKGAGIVELWDETAALIIFGIVILSLSIARFQKRLE